MNVSEIMTTGPACCTRDTNLREVARMMVENHCGVIPVVKAPEDQELVGVITDRDIVYRLIAEDKNPLEMSAGQCMTDTIVAISADASLEECARLMEEHQIRRVPVVDSSGKCRGVVSQADLAQYGPTGMTSHVVKEVSVPTEEAAGL